MSYARWGCNGSDVYVYAPASDLGKVACCGCPLGDGDEVVLPPSEMLDHLEEHRKQGHVVPDYTFEDIRRDMELGWFESRKVEGS